PILTDVNKVTRDLAMLPAERQAAELEKAIRQLRQEIDRARLEALDLTEYLQQDEPNRTLHSPVTLADLETMLTQSQATRHLFQPHPEIAQAYWLTWHGVMTAVTFNADQFDNHPNTLKFLSYGSVVLTEILGSIPAPEAYPSHLARFSSDQPWTRHAWYGLRGTRPQPLNSFTLLRQAVRTQAAVPPDALIQRAREQFTQETEAINATYQQRLSQHTQQQKAILQAKARRLLEQ